METLNLQLLTLYQYILYYLLIQSINRPTNLSNPPSDNNLQLIT